MSVEVWTGTPHEMVKAASKDTQPAAVKWLRDWLDGLVPQARRYDPDSVDRIIHVREELLKVAHITAKDHRRWEFEYLDLTIRVELRKT